MRSFKGRWTVQLLVLLLAVGTVAGTTGCPATAPGEDPILVQAQRTYSNGRDSLDTLFNLEMNNKDLIESKLPGTHAVVDAMKVQAKVALPELLKAIDTYAANKDRAAIDKWEAVVKQLLESAKVIIGNINKQGVVYLGPTNAERIALWAANGDGGVR